MQLNISHNQSLASHNHLNHESIINHQMRFLIDHPTENIAVTTRIYGFNPQAMTKKWIWLSIHRHSHGSMMISSHLKRDIKMRGLVLRSMTLKTNFFAGGLFRWYVWWVGISEHRWSSIWPYNEMLKGWIEIPRVHSL